MRVSPLGLIGLLLVFLAAGVAGAATVSVRLVSITPAGTTGNALSRLHQGRVPMRQVSDSGEIAVFTSFASDLVPGDTNVADVFARNLKTGVTTLVSATPARTPGNSHSHTPTISADGRLVCFVSGATNLTGAADGNGRDDIFVRDLATGTTRLVSSTPDGRAGNGASFDPYLTGNGRYVIFGSLANDLVPAIPDGNNTADIFLRDLATGQTHLISVAPDGSAGGAAFQQAFVSENGARAVFSSAAALSSTQADSNGVEDVYIRELGAQVTRLVTANAAGAAAAGRGGDHPRTTPDGRFVAFESWSTDMVPGLNDANSTKDVFVRDLDMQRTFVASAHSSGVGTASGHSRTPVLDAAGQWVAFVSLAPDLAPGATDTNGVSDVYVRRLPNGPTFLASARAGSNTAADGASEFPILDALGRFVLFSSSATDLAAGDTHSGRDVFLREVPGGVTTLMSARPDGRSGSGESGASFYAALSADGKTALFHSQANDLVPSDTNGHAEDIFAAALVTPPPPPPTLSGCTVSPRSVSAAGGPVNFSVKVNASTSLSSVTATLRRAGSPTLTVNLSPIAGSYQGTYRFIANPAGSRTYQVTFKATDSAGGSAELACGTVTIVGVDRQPPVVSSVTVSPNNVGYLGRTVTIVANASDNIGLSSVTALINVGSQRFQAPLRHLFGLRYQGTFRVPANPTYRDRTFSVGARAIDRSRNRTDRYFTTIIQSPKPDREPPVVECFPGPDVSWNRLRAFVSGRVHDNGVVTAVRVEVTPPDNRIYSYVMSVDQQTRIFQGLVTVAINHGRTAVPYRIAVTATDGGGNRTRVECGTILVLPKP